MKIESSYLIGSSYIYGTLLFDLKDDPNQENPLTDEELERRMIKLLVAEMKKSESPIEQYERLGIPNDGEVTNEHLKVNEKYAGVKEKIGDTEITWVKKGKSSYYLFLTVVPRNLQKSLVAGIEKAINQGDIQEVDEDIILEIVGKIMPPNLKPFLVLIKDIIKKKAK
jgi:hypothetical protein